MYKFLPPNFLHFTPLTIPTIHPSLPGYLQGNSSSQSPQIQLMPVVVRGGINPALRKIQPKPLHEMEVGGRGIKEENSGYYQQQRKQVG